MNCRKLAELLLDFIDGELPAEDRAHLEAHLEKCPPCEVYLETYRQTILISRRLPCRPLPPELARRLWAALDQMGGCRGPAPRDAQPDHPPGGA